MKLALGTAQFGMQYGVANIGSDFNLQKISEILEYASKNEINTLDTAIHYGEAERRLGLIGIKDWNVITKLHSSNMDETDPLGWLEKQVESSLDNLRIQTLSGMLIHDGKLLSGKYGKLIWKKLNQLKNQGLIGKLGISIYQPSELDDLYEQFSFDLVQAPLNVFDRRIEDTGWLAKIENENSELHIRSIFLQGLLLMEPSLRPEKFNNWQHLWKRWEDWLSDNNINALEACLNAFFNKPGIDKIIIGIDSLRHLQEIVSILRNTHAIEFPLDLSCNDELLINPSKWDSL